MTPCTCEHDYWDHGTATDPLGGGLVMACTMADCLCHTFTENAPCEACGNETDAQGRYVDGTRYCEPCASEASEALLAFYGPESDHAYGR